MRAVDWTGRIERAREQPRRLLAVERDECDFGGLQELDRFADPARKRELRHVGPCVARAEHEQNPAPMQSGRLAERAQERGVVERGGSEAAAAVTGGGLELFGVRVQ